MGGTFEERTDRGRDSEQGQDFLQTFGQKKKGMRQERQKKKEKDISLYHSLISPCLLPLLAFHVSCSSLST